MREYVTSRRRRCPSTPVWRQPFVIPVDGSFSTVSKLTQGNSMGDGPTVPCVINRTTSTKRAGRTASFVMSSSSVVHHRHAAWS